MSSPPKKHPTLGCCGLDCGLCPRYYTRGDSRCPGCQGEGFATKHPPCKIHTCCYKKQGLECCGECDRFPCDVIAPWGSGDSFISHAVCLENLAWIKKHGVAAFAGKQQERMALLREMIDQFDDGRSRSFFCVAAALLPVERVKAAIVGAASAPSGGPPRAKQLRALLEAAGRELGTSLVLRK